jgi:HEPN domain-containing protein
MAKKFLKQYEILIIKAKDDLTSAKYLLDGFHNHSLELRLDIIFFHFQQSAEKLIKAILDLSNVKFPHTHDLEELLKILSQENIKTLGNITLLVPLTTFAVEGRYAIIHDDIEDTDKYIIILEELLTFTEKLVAKKSMNK